MFGWICTQVEKLGKELYSSHSLRLFNKVADYYEYPWILKSNGYEY